MSFGIGKIKQRKEQNPEKKSQSYSYQVLQIRTEPLSIWALASSWNIGVTTFKFIIGEMTNGRLIFWSETDSPELGHALSVCAGRIGKEALLTFCTPEFSVSSDTQFLLLSELCRHFTGRTDWCRPVMPHNRWCYVLGHTASKSLYWNQDSWLVLGGRTPVVSAWYVWSSSAFAASTIHSKTFPTSAEIYGSI